VFRRFIRISRRDKVDQAISWMLALERNIWNSEKPGEVAPERGFQPDDVGKIDALAVRAREADRYWDDMIAALRLETVLRINYEELRADSRREVAQALAFLDVDVPVEEVPPPTTVKISGEGTREIKREYLKRSGQVAA
jgi:LPS sulfotransferase NodH